MNQGTEEKKETPPPTMEHLKLIVDIWKHSVSVQMHFNDMEMKVRNLYFTVLAASIGLIGVVKGSAIQIPQLHMEVSIIIMVFVAIVPISMLFYFVDRHWYHRLLQGAVNQCIEIENKYINELPEIQLGAKIKKESRVEFKGIWKWLFCFVSDSRFKKGCYLHSDAKIEVVYKSVMYAVVLIIIFYGGFNSIRIHQHPLIPYLTSELINELQNMRSPDTTSPSTSQLAPSHQKSPVTEN